MFGTKEVMFALQANLSSWYVLIKVNDKFGPQTTSLNEVQRLCFDI